MIKHCQKSIINKNRAQEDNDESKHNDVTDKTAPKENDEILKELNSLNTVWMEFSLHPQEIFISYMNYVYKI